VLNVNVALRHLDINPNSVMRAVQEVRLHIEERGTEPSEAISFMQRVFGTAPSYAEVHEQKMCSPFVYAVTVAQAMTEAAIKQHGQIDNDTLPLLLANAKKRAEGVIMKPENRCMYAEAESVTGGNTTSAAVAKSVDTVVEVKASGEIKKGGKQILAEALYRKHVLDTPSPLTNQEFIKVLIAEAQMTKGGATTYAFNLKKKLGAPKTE
jgi:hypothetical protein